MLYGPGPREGNQPMHEYWDYREEEFEEVMFRLLSAGLDLFRRVPLQIE